MLRSGPDAASRDPARGATGDPPLMESDDSVKDQPLFEVDDTTTSYSPPRGVRPRWVDRGRPQPAQVPAGTQVSAQHWFEPDAGRAVPSVDPREPSPRPTPSRPVMPGGGRERGTLLAAGIAIALVSGGLASAGTVGLLAAGGWLGTPGGGAGGPDASDEPSARTIYVDQSNLTRVAAEVIPSVVTIVAGTTSRDPLTELVTQADSGATIASGVIYDAEGWIITNRHVVCGAGAIVALLDDGRQLPADLYGIDSLTDLAILHVDADDLRAASMGDSASLRPGQLSMAIGSAGNSLTTTVTSGVVSALGRDLMVADPCRADARRPLRNAIQTDAAVSDGSSGGALVNAAGAVVGINTSVAGSSDGVSFAIPVNIAKPIMEQAVAGKPLTRPWLGITYTSLNAGIAKAHRLTIDHGAWLRASSDGSLPAVIPGSPADQAGLQDGDILTAIDDQRIDSAHSLDDILAQYRPEDQDPISVWLLRDGSHLEVRLTLGTRVGES
jgi:S1-C subfamily serine protease